MEKNGDVLLFIFCMLPIMVGIGLVIANTLGQYSYQRKHESNSKTDDSSVFKQAKLWQKSLSELGETREFDTLLNIAKKHDTPLDSVPFEAVFTHDEYRFVLSKFYSDLSKVTDGFAGSFSFETLPVAVHVKNISQYALKLKDSISILEEKERVSELSLKGKEKMERLKEELTSVETEITNFTYNRVTTRDSVGRVIGKRLTFYKFAGEDEEKLLELVDQNLVGGKPEFKPHVPKADIPTSPALEELNEFLNEHTLPSDVYEELSETMKAIQQTLIGRNKEEEEETIRTKAKVLNDTAKQYHQIKEDAD
ncbi:hypothetical protein JMA_39060 (plasmid) [Jeotgalibacillus malaysiensis]|uniref:Uncharacterized protein n=1 Tax=Jeotgalibacillus malaysiensis TaxID=1508404 RepID=A0A0B5AZ25_9BACL|nr:hypothetical protein [Jeotgalibacillus malaysiensis]AJD93224.1 hypothetical protein JMA_39060 [Jeotgalibacillus malaysiensis]